MADRPQHRQPRKRPTPTEAAVARLGARPPSEQEIISLRRMLRANPLGASYLLCELCAFGKVAPPSEQTQATAFRLGSQGVATALAAITEAAILRLATEEARDV